MKRLRLAALLFVGLASIWYGESISWAASAASYRPIVEAAYREWLGRLPNQGELDYWTGALASGQRTEAAMRQSHQNHLKQYERDAAIVRSYQEVFGRGPVEGELNHWRAQIQAGVSYKQMVQMHREWLAKNPVTMAGPVGVISAHTPLCMDVAGASRDRGAAVITWFCHSGDNQRFVYMGQNGEIRVYGNKCLDASGGSGNAGDKIIIWDCNGQANQKWVRTNQGEIRGINNRCIDIKNASVLPWGELILWDCHGGRNQKWAAFRVVNYSNQPIGYNFDLGGNQNLLPPAFADSVNTYIIGNTAGGLALPGGNALTQVTPLANVTP